jgi:hypothetical protein
LFTYKIAAVCFIVIEKRAKKSLWHWFFPKYAKSGNFRRCVRPLDKKFSPAAKCSFTGYASCFKAGKATLKIVAWRCIEYYCFIFIAQFILFILLMLSKRIKK